jgi:flagellar biosynthesis protein FlhF
MPEVVGLIKNEFGLGAVILSQRDNPDTGWAEVTAGVREEDLPGSSAGPPAAPESPPAAARPVSPHTPPQTGLAAYRKTLAGGRREAGEKAPAEEEDWTPEAGRRLRDELLAAVTGGVGQIRELILDLAHRRMLTEKWRDRTDLIQLYRRLLDTGLEPEPARDLTEKAAESQAAWGGDLMEQLRLTVRPLVKCREGNLPRILTLAGPSGSGKSTVLVKLAALLQKRGLKPAAINLDTLKLGAAGQLAQYARIMGLGLKTCQSRAEFDEAREIFDQAEVILVDTSARDFSGGTLKPILEGTGAQSLLVLPANFKSEDLFQLYERTVSPPAGGMPLWAAVLSKLDETGSLGSLAGLILRTNPYLGFFSAGPRVPEDFGPASADKFLDLWLRPPAKEGGII